MNNELIHEAVVLLLQDLQERKDPDTKKGGKYWRSARSLLDRLGAPYMTIVEQVPTTDKTPSQIGSNWLIDMAEDAKEEVDDFIPERQGRDGLSLDVSALIAERDLLADQLAGAGNEILDLREEVDEAREEVKSYMSMLEDATAERDQLKADLADARARVKFLEGATDRLSEQCRDLMAVNVRLRKEKNEEAVKRIEGVA